MNGRRKNSIAVGVAFCAAILVPILHHYQLRFALASYIAELKAKGEPMELAQVLPPAVPTEENGAPLILAALSNLPYKILIQTNPPQAMEMVAPGRAMIGWQQPDIRSSRGTNSWEDLARELGAEENRLDSLRILTNHPLLDFNLDYGQGSSIRLPHLTVLRRADNLLKASALHNLRQGNVTRSCDNVHTMLALVKSQSEERIEISQLVRTAIAYASASVTWEILQDTKISEVDLGLLQQDWQSLEFIKAGERAYLMGRDSTALSLEHFRTKPDDEWQWVITYGRIDKIWYKNQWLWFWSYADEKRALQIYEVLIEATRMAETNHSYHLAQEFTTANFLRLGLEKPMIREGLVRMDIDQFAMRWLFSEDAQDSFRLLRRVIVTETARNLVVTAIAIKRYKLRYQHLPETLQDLTPDLLKTVPIDWMDGQGLRYRRTTDGTYLLYSVGDNGKDDGGDPSLEPRDDPYGVPGFYWQNPNAKDFVWPQPATSKEVQTFYEKQVEKGR